MKIGGRILGATAVTLALALATQWVVSEELNYRETLKAWDVGPMQIPLYSPVQESQPSRTFPWEALLGGLTLGGCAIGWILSEFKAVDQRLDNMETHVQRLDSADELARQQHEASDQ